MRCCEPVSLGRFLQSSGLVRKQRQLEDLCRQNTLMPMEAWNHTLYVYVTSPWRDEVMVGGSGINLCSLWFRDSKMSRAFSVLLSTHDSSLTGPSFKKKQVIVLLPCYFALGGGHFTCLKENGPEWLGIWASEFVPGCISAILASSAVS